MSMEGVTIKNCTVTLGEKEEVSIDQQFSLLEQKLNLLETDLLESFSTLRKAEILYIGIDKIPDNVNPKITGLVGRRTKLNVLDSKIEELFQIAKSIRNLSNRTLNNMQGIKKD